MKPAAGELRPHWQQFVSSLERLGRDELSLRWENARRIIREHGVTYNVYGDPQGMDRPWELDMMPLLIPSEEWRKIEAGLMQRSQVVQPDPGGYLRAAKIIAGRAFASRPGLCQSEFPAPLPWHAHSRASISASPRGGFDALVRRPMVGHFGPDAGPVRRGLRAGKPDRAVANFSRRNFANCQTQRLASFFCHAARHAARTGHPQLR